MSFWFTNEWFVFNNAIDKKTCNKIKRLAKGDWEEAGIRQRDKVYERERTLPTNYATYKKNSKIRITDISWTNDQWLYDLIWPYMEEANKRSGWNLDIKAAEGMQIARYRKGGFYSWHKDGSSDSLSSYDKPESPLLHGNVRKLSMTLVLNDNFEGGALEFASYSKEKCEITPIKPKEGDMIFFTSGMEHRIAPVTKGVRYSLVNWFIGPPIK